MKTLNDIPIINYLEYHVVHGCNLKCSGCSHFSHLTTGGLKSVDDLVFDLEPWTKRVHISSFSLMGGEPLLNKDINQLMSAARKLLPDAALILVSNGLLLKDEHLESLVASDFELIVSQHSRDELYLQRFNEIERRIKEWQNKGLRAQIRNSVDNWSQRYHEENGKITPYQDGDPTQSYKICRAKHCKQLFNQRLWKCPPVAYIKLMDVDKQWDLMKNYTGVGIDCTAEELRRFLSVESEEVCGLCSKNVVPKDKHINPVAYK
jgi:organic radical activating enzyme